MPAIQVTHLTKIFTTKRKAAALYMGGSPVTILPAGGRFIASFAIPAGMEGLNFTILHWDKSTGAWVELPDVMVTPEGASR
ncbi:MAG: hypothetical protein ABIL11_07635 [Chloroflexota bacterium]